MKQYILSICLVFIAICAHAQLDLSTHFMSNISQSNLTNPAKMNEYKITVNLPSIYAGFYNSSFKPSDVLEKNGNTLMLDMDKFINGISNDGLNFQSNVNVETFGFAFRLKKFQVSLNHGVRVSTFHHIPKEMLQFAWGGNAQFIDETINIAPSQNMMMYQEFGLGLAYQVSDKLALGTKLKYLIGSGTYHTSRSMATIYTNPEYYQLTAETDYTINTAGLPESDVEEWEFLNFDNFEPSLFGNNKGVAFDFGATFNLTEKLTVQASVLNIGKINWEEEVYNYSSNGTVNFEGLDFKPILDEGELEVDEILDTIANTFEFQTTQNTFSSTLPSTFYLSGNYKINKTLTAGALLFAQKNQAEMTPAFAVNIRKDFGNVFSIGTQFATIKGGAHNVGLSTALKLGPVQLYLTSDNILPVFNPLNGQNVNLRFGMNLAFNKVTKKEKIEVLEN